MKVTIIKNIIPISSSISATIRSVSPTGLLKYIKQLERSETGNNEVKIQTNSINFIENNKSKIYNKQPICQIHTTSIHKATFNLHFTLWKLVMLND